VDHEKPVMRGESVGSLVRHSKECQKIALVGQNQEQ
jgi:hypothetical protein